MDKRLCKNCKLWYTTKANQCDIPSCGIQLIEDGNEDENNFNIAIGKIDKDGIVFIKNNLKFINYRNDDKTEIFGKPSELNKNNDCYFYQENKKLSFWQVIFGQ